MRGQSSDQFDPSSGWRVAQSFLAIHGRSPDGEHLSGELIQFLMIGVWVGCRYALLDRDLALTIAALGNTQTALVFEALGRGFVAEFGEPMQKVVHDVLNDRGFTHGWAEVVEAPPETPTVSSAIEEAQDVLRKWREHSGDGREGSET